MNLLIHIDGASRGNPGPAAAGVLIQNRDDRRTVHEAGYHLGSMTNNVAEYRGLILALELTKQLGAQRVHIRSDSQLLVRQMTGQYRVKSSDLKPLVAQAHSMLEDLETWQIQHVSREENAQADDLANQALDAKQDVIVTSTGTAQRSAPKQTSLRWTAQLIGTPGPRCPSKCASGKRYIFGPDTPEGFCVWATLAVLNNGPLIWSDPQQHDERTECPHCTAAIQINRSDA